MTYRMVPPLSLRHGLAIIAACLLLAGCAFRPMYGRSSLSPQLASIYVEPVAERDGYELRNRLIDLLQSDGQETGKKYHLKIVLNEASQGIALQNDAPSRATIRLWKRATP